MSNVLSLKILTQHIISANHDVNYNNMIPICQIFNDLNWNLANTLRLNFLLQKNISWFLKTHIINICLHIRALLQTWLKMKSINYWGHQNSWNKNSFMELNDSFCMNVIVMLSGCFITIIIIILFLFHNHYTDKLHSWNYNCDYSILELHHLGWADFFSTTVQISSTSGHLSLLLTVTNKKKKKMLKKHIYVKVLNWSQNFLNGQYWEKALL